MRILVCGGRKFGDRSLLARALSPYRPKNTAVDVSDVVLILGGAPGADALAEEWADVWGVRKRLYLAKWTDLSHPDALIRTRVDGTQYDARAGLRRNQKMIDEGRPDMVIAFPGGNGTADMVRRARAAGVRIMRPETDGGR